MGGSVFLCPLQGSVLVILQHSVAEKVRTVRKYRSRPLCEYPGFREHGR